MMDALVVTSIDRIPRAEWDRCFRGELEGWDYHRAVEQSGLPGFSHRYVALFDRGALLAAAPAFITDYRLDTTVQGPWKRVSSALARAMPRLMSLRMICLGSPVSEVCHLGFAPSVSDIDKPRLLTRMLRALEDYAREQRVGLICVKDAPDAAAELWRFALDAGYQRLPSLPTAVLDLDGCDEAAYLARLSGSTRKDVRRKMKMSAELRIERRSTIDDVLPEIMALYDQTLARSDLQFERLTPQYFAGVLRHMGARASCLLYWHVDTLIGFNLVLHDGDRLIDKFLGMHGELGRRYNLYFVSWMTNVRLCIAGGIPCYQSGQAGYGPKRRLGSKLQPNWLYFRHRKPWLNRVLKLVGQLVRVDRYDPDLGSGDRAAA